MLDKEDLEAIRAMLLAGRLASSYSEEPIDPEEAAMDAFIAADAFIFLSEQWDEYRKVRPLCHYLYLNKGEWTACLKLEFKYSEKSLGNTVSTINRQGASPIEAYDNALKEKKRAVAELEEAGRVIVE